jgi:hypothetical protein
MKNKEKISCNSNRPHDDDNDDVDDDGDGELFLRNYDLNRYKLQEQHIRPLTLPLTQKITSSASERTAALESW